MVLRDDVAMQRIVVGVDGSTNAEVALRWALEEAQAHDAALQAVMAWSYLDQRHADHGVDFDPAYGEAQAKAALKAALAAVGPSRPVEQKVVCDLAGSALLEAADDADLVVVGARGRGGFAGLLLGSVSQQVLEHATCPVAVVRDEALPAADKPVVVGVDGSESGNRALRWAAAEARARGAALHLVHAWHVPYLVAPMGAELVDAIEESGKAVLQVALADPALEGLTTEGHLVCDGAAQAMMAKAEDASLVVVGSRGLGRFKRALLGSTSRQLAHHAPCPLVVVPPDADD